MRGKRSSEACLAVELAHPAYPGHVRLSDSVYTMASWMFRLERQAIRAAVVASMTDRTAARASHT